MDYFRFKVIRRLRGDKFKVLENKIIHVDVESTLQSTIETLKIEGNVEEICVFKDQESSASFFYQIRPYDRKLATFFFFLGLPVCFIASFFLIIFSDHMDFFPQKILVKHFI